MTIARKRREPTAYESFLVKLQAHIAAKAIDADAHTMAQALVALAGQFQKIQETECERELTNIERNREERVQEQLRELSAVLNLPMRFGGDPRGYTVKCFLADGSHNTWGGKEDGWGIPTSTRD
jgi:hypothetical protein